MLRNIKFWKTEWQFLETSSVLVKKPIECKEKQHEQTTHSQLTRKLNYENIMPFDIMVDLKI